MPLLALLRANWLHIGIGLAVLFGLWYVDHRGYQRAKEHYEAQEQKRQGMEARLAKQLTSELQAAISKIDHTNSDRLASIDRVNRTIVQPVLTREIANDPRYSNPDCAVSDSILRAINTGRAATGDTAAKRTD